MTRIKLCGLSRECDVEVANKLKPDYIGFVFAQKSRRYVSHERAAELKALLHHDVSAVGVFVNEDAGIVAELLKNGVIDVAQLHGSEDEEYIKRLRELTSRPIIKAFRISFEQDVIDAKKSTADYVLLDSGGGTGNRFDWSLIKKIDRPYFLAGGISAENVIEAITTLAPYAVDISSGIETDGLKDPQKMQAFVNAVRKEREK